MMGSIHNDLTTWAGRAKARGQDTIEITTELAEKASDLIDSQANEIAELEQQLARFRLDRPYTVGFSDGWEASEGRPFSLVESLTKALEPFSFIAGELFAKNYNDSDIVFTVETTTEKGSNLKLDVTFKTFREARNAIGSFKAKSPSSDRAASEEGASTYIADVREYANKRLKEAKGSGQ